MENIWQEEAEGAATLAICAACRTANGLDVPAMDGAHNCDEDCPVAGVCPLGAFNVHVQLRPIGQPVSVPRRGSGQMVGDTRPVDLPMAVGQGVL